MFALHRRKAWGTAAVEASVWDFDVTGLTYVGTIPLPNIAPSNYARLTSFQFVDEGAALIYSNQHYFYKLALPTPYSLASSDLVPVDTSINFFGADLSCGQFAPNGRTFYIYRNKQSGNFGMFQMDVPFDPFSKTSPDLITVNPSVYVTGTPDVKFSTDGLKLLTFPNNGSQYEMYLYSLTEPFDASTLSLARSSVSLGSVHKDDTSGTGYTCFTVSADGLRILTAGGSNTATGRRIRMWALQEPWDIGRISHVGTILLEQNQASNISFIAVDPTASWLYVLTGTNLLVQYAIPQS